MKRSRLITKSERALLKGVIIVFRLYTSLTMTMGNIDIYALVRSCANANPTDPAQYMRDQQQLRDLYSEPGELNQHVNCTAHEQASISRCKRLLRTGTSAEMSDCWRRF